ncbi:MAG TPA: MBL fold metallo-hydrolase [Candidatus Saccharimonadales bacterium]|nr:MBL fold metallo-hydrolase [Candidatus Saccharimonadales bacterium]
MDIQFHGANCLSLSTAGNKVRVVVDDNLADLGGKSVTRPGDIALFTTAHGAPAAETKLTIDMPGEYEVSDVSVYAIQARAHMEEGDTQTATMYKIITRDLSIFISGHIYPDLTDDQLESIGMIDVMAIPVGGSGYTLDAIGALKIIKKIEPKIIIPTHYDMPGINYPVPQQDLQHVLHELSMEPKETTAKLKLKSAELPDATQLIVLERS